MTEDRERRRRGENGRLGEGRDWRRKKKEKVGGRKAFVKLKGRAPSDGVGQGMRVTGRSNW